MKKDVFLDMIISDILYIEDYCKPFIKSFGHLQRQLDTVNGIMTYAGTKANTTWNKTKQDLCCHMSTLCKNITQWLGIYYQNERNENEYTKYDMADLCKLWETLVTMYEKYMTISL